MLFAGCVAQQRWSEMVCQACVQKGNVALSDIATVIPPLLLENRDQICISVYRPALLMTRMNQEI